MARNNTQKLLDVDPDTGKILDDEELSDKENLEADQDRALDDIISEFEKSPDDIVYKASVNKIPDGYKKGGKEQWCFDVDSAEITGMKSRLRDEYGPGIYRVRIYKNSKIIRCFDYNIAKPAFQYKQPETPNENPALNALADQLRALSETQARLIERIAGTPQQQLDPMDQMERMSRIFANLNGGHNNNGNNNHGMSAKDTIDLFTRGMELAHEMNASGGEDNWLSVFKELIKNVPVGELLSNLSQQRQPPQLAGPGPQRLVRGPIPPRNPQQPPVMPVQPPPVIPPANERITPASHGAALEQNMRYLIEKAARDADPGLYAEWLLDNSDPALIQQMANDPNLLNQLAVVFPRLNAPNIRAWFNELIGFVREGLAGTPNQEDNANLGIGTMTMQPGGNTTDANGVAAPHSGGNTGDQDNPENHATPS